MEKIDKPLLYSNHKNRLKMKPSFDTMISLYLVEFAAQFIADCDLQVSSKTNEIFF